MLAFLFVASVLEPLDIQSRMAFTSQRYCPAESCHLQLHVPKTSASPVQEFLRHHSVSGCKTSGPLYAIKLMNGHIRPDAEYLYL
jgi:hypothetical protein